MTETPPDPAPAPVAPVRPSTESANAQTIVSMAIVVALWTIALAAILAALVEKTVAAVAFGAVGVVVGSLATALNAPSGIGSVLSAAKRGEGQ